KARPTTTDTPAPIATIWDRTATTQPTRPDRIPTRVRWDHLQRMVMGYTTWWGMSLSGVGIGLGRRMREAVIPVDRHLGASVCCGAARGTTAPSTRGVRVASSALRRTPTTLLVFVV